MNATIIKVLNSGDGYIEVSKAISSNAIYWHTLSVEYRDYCKNNKVIEFALSQVLTTFFYEGYLVFVIYSYLDFFESFFKKHHQDYKVCLLKDE